MININLYGWIKRGQRRITILKVMQKPMTPCEIKKATKQYTQKIGMNNTSETLKQLVDKGIATCINNQEKMGRLYKLTEQGEEIRDEILRG